MAAGVPRSRAATRRTRNVDVFGLLQASAVGGEEPEMSIKYAVLGLLIERRGYGYDIANRLQERLGPDFAGGTRAVYISLDHLRRDALVSEVERVRAGRQTKIYYEATPAGEERFAKFMHDPPSREPLRGQMYLKLAVARGEHLPVLAAELERLELQCLGELRERAGAIDLGRNERAEVAWSVATRWLTDAAALERLHGDLRWIRMAIQTIRSAHADGSVSLDQLRRAAALGHG